jgi:ribosomal-protein-serine acetyltransferase
MTQAVRAMERFAFVDLRLERVQICNAVTNTRSRAIPERLGYTLEGILRRHVLGGLGRPAVDHSIYGLLKPEWEARETKLGDGVA